MWGPGWLGMVMHIMLWEYIDVQDFGDLLLGDLNDFYCRLKKKNTSYALSNKRPDMGCNAIFIRGVSLDCYVLEIQCDLLFINCLDEMASIQRKIPCTPKAPIRQGINHFNVSEQ